MLRATAAYRALHIENSLTRPCSCFPLMALSLARTSRKIFVCLVCQHRPWITMPAHKQPPQPGVTYRNNVASDVVPQKRKGRGCAPPDRKGTRLPLGGAPDTAPVLRDFLKRSLADQVDFRR
jgi:hypothetical protein